MIAYILIIVVGTLCLVAYSLLRSKVQSVLSIMSATAVTSDGLHYGFNLKLHRGEVDQMEWVWLCVLFPSRLGLATIGKNKDTQSVSFFQAFKRLGEGDWETGEDVRKICAENMTIRSVVDGKSIAATISGLKNGAREIQVHLSGGLLDEQYFNSWVVFLMHAANAIDTKHRNLLKKALRYMAKDYIFDGIRSIAPMTKVAKSAIKSAIGDF